MEEKSVRIYNTNTTFFRKITNTLSKLFVPTKVGINSFLISLKRNNLLKAYNMYVSDNIPKDKKESYLKKCEDYYAIYLEAIDKYIMESVYSNVKNGTATEFEKLALTNYYEITHLKDNEYLEYKYRKQKYLLELDEEGVVLNQKEKTAANYSVSKEVKQIIYAPGTVKRMTIAVAVNKILTTQEKEELEKLIISASGADLNRGDMINVTSLQFAAVDANRAQEAAFSKAIAQEKQQELMYGNVIEMKWMHNNGQ